MSKKGQFSRQTKVSLSPYDRNVLIRKGNALFNEGKILEAERIFLTVNYSVGIKRMGDYYLNQKDFIGALRMYKASSSTDSLARLAEEVAQALRHWMQK